MDNQTAVIVNDEQIAVRDLLHTLKVQQGAQFVEGAVMDAIVRQAAREIPPPTDAELQQAADEFRRSTGLYESEETLNWLKQAGLTVEAWEERLERDLIARKVRDHVTEGQVEAYFSSNRAALDRATVAQVVVGGEEVAAELLAQIAEEGADFGAVAREHSIDPISRERGGYVGPVGRGALGADGEALVFNAQPGQVVGPIRTEGGWMLLRVDSVAPAQLDDGTREQIKETLFREWLQQQRTRARVETPILDVV